MNLFFLFLLTTSISEEQQLTSIASRLLNMQYTKDMTKEILFQYAISLKNTPIIEELIQMHLNINQFKEYFSEYSTSEMTKIEKFQEEFLKKENERNIIKQNEYLQKRYFEERVPIYIRNLMNKDPIQLLNNHIILKDLEEKLKLEFLQNDDMHYKLLIWYFKTLCIIAEQGKRIIYNNFFLETRVFKLIFDLGKMLFSDEVYKNFYIDQIDFSNFVINVAELIEDKNFDSLIQYFIAIMPNILINKSLYFTTILRLFLITEKKTKIFPKSYQCLLNIKNEKEEEERKKEGYKKYQHDQDLRKRYFNILGIPYHSTNEEIKKAYKALALKYHPDKVPNEEIENATDYFKTIQNAYDCLVKSAP